jgi:hypothetical protein
MMNPRTPFAFATAAVLGFCILAGCSKAPSNETATTASTTSPQNPSTEAVGRAASNFLDAVIKGDTQRAFACLTPQAMHRIIASGKPFAPPGFDSMTFKLGEVRMPAVDRAFVSFALTNVSNGQPTSDEVACVMRLINDEWRVCGLAAWGPNQTITELNFEADQTRPAQKSLSPGMAGPSNTIPPSTTAPSPRVANEAGTDGFTRPQ